MSLRIVPWTALSVMLLVIFWAVVATAQQPGGQLPVNQQVLPIQPGDLQAGVQPQPQIPGQIPGALMPGGQAPASPINGPFQLSPAEQQLVDRVLEDWQAVSGKVKTLEADFTRWDFDGVFGDGKTAKRVVGGKLRYSAPDKGFYELTDQSEKWVCTGTAIFEFKKELSKVREYRLPPQLQGQAISDGPMPFVFGVEKNKMNARYWVRMTTPPDAKGQVWMEAYPKLAKDAANFQKVDVILNFTLNADGTVADLQPHALNMHLPNGKDRTVYRFDKVNVNGVLGTILNGIDWFVRPNTPIGWQHELADDGTQPDAGPPAGGFPGNPAGQNPGAPGVAAPGVAPGVGMPGAGIGTAPQTTVPR